MRLESVSAQFGGFCRGDFLPPDGAPGGGGGGCLEFRVLVWNSEIGSKVVPGARRGVQRHHSAPGVELWSRRPPATAVSRRTVAVKSRAPDGLSGIRGICLEFGAGRVGGRFGAPASVFFAGSLLPWFFNTRAAIPGRCEDRRKDKTMRIHNSELSGIGGCLEFSCAGSPNSRQHVGSPNSTPNRSPERAGAGECRRGLHANTRAVRGPEEG